MRDITINEEQMTQLLKEFIAQYQGGTFTHCTFEDAVENGQHGCVVHFHFGERETPRREEEDPSPASPISIPFPAFGGSDTPSTPDFGGGSSGGAGASGGW